MGIRSARSTIAALRVFAAVTIVTTPAAGQEAADAIRLIATVGHPELTEMSGIAAASMPGIFWVHNDSGDTARVFAIDTTGSVVPPTYQTPIPPESWTGHRIDAAWHDDWEAMAVENGVMYLADVGNNGNSRRDLGVYVVKEFDPRVVSKARAQRYLPVRYPDQERFPAALWHFDCEAVFSDGGKLYFLTKHRRTGQPMGWEPGTKLYRLDTEHTDRDNVLTLIDRHDEIALPTGADVSPNGQRLAILTYRRLWVFERPSTGDAWLRSAARILDLPRALVKQNEAIAWESNDSLLMTNEQREIFRIPLAALR